MGNVFFFCSASQAIYSAIHCRILHIALHLQPALSPCEPVLHLQRHPILPAPLHHTPYPDKAPRCGAFLSCFSSRNYGHFECCCHLSATFMQHKIRRALPSCSAVSNNSPSNKKSKATLNCVSFIDPRPPTIIGSSVLQRAAPNSSSWEFIFSSPSTHTGVARPGSICFIALRHTADPGPGVLFLN